MFGFGKKAGPTIGLDINSSTIAVLQLEKTKTDLRVARFASTLTPPEIVREGLLSDPEAVGAAVRELLDSAGMTAKGPAPVTNIGIPGQSVVIRLMPVPKGMPNDELNDVVRQEAINNLPFPIDEANLDWTRVPGTGRTDPDGVEREDILLGAIQKVIVDGYWRMAETAGIQIGKLEISSLAAVRAMAFSGQLKDNLSLVVNIRQDATDITLVNKAVPLFSRSVLLGVETIMESMQRSINASAEEAKELLPRIQLLGVPTVDPRIGQAAQVARSVCGDLTAEVGRSLEFYMSQVGMVKVDQVIVCGAGTSIPEIDQFIANRLNLNTTVGNPLQGVVYDRNQIMDSMRPHHTMLMGLLVDPATFSSKTVSIDLNQGLPDTESMGDQVEEGYVEDVPTPWFAPALGVGAVLALIVCGAYMFFLYSVIPGKDATIADLETQITQNKEKLKTLTKDQEDVDDLQARKDSLEAIVNHGTPMTAVLQSMKDNVPKGVSISSVKIIGSTVAIGGYTTDFTKVSHLAINLQGSNMFNTIDVSSIKRHYPSPATIMYQLDGSLAPDINKKTVALDTPSSYGADASDPVASGGPRVLNFYSAQIVNCQRIKPIIDQAQQRYGQSFQFQTINVDDPANEALLKRYDVKMAPVLVFIDGSGQETDRVQGVQSFEGNSAPFFAACDRLSKVASKTVTK